MSSGTVPVVVIGAGTTGLAAATLLAQYGVECLVLERREGVYPVPRAVHLDDEIHRILARPEATTFGTCVALAGFLNAVGASPGPKAEVDRRAAEYRRRKKRKAKK